MKKSLGIYRGTVLENYDPEVKGRIKVWVPGVYPEAFKETPLLLPWAEPVMPLFGGSYSNLKENDLNTETGVTTIPHEGAELWVFFENGNLQKPKFFGACQGGEGWHSEHNNQHVIKTDNVRIRVDEEPTLPIYPRLPLEYHTITNIFTTELKWRTYVEMMENDIKERLKKVKDVDYTIKTFDQFVSIDVNFYIYRTAAADFKKVWDDFFDGEFEAGRILVSIPTKILDVDVGKIDDPEPNDISTCKFDSYNNHCTYTSQAKKKIQTPTRVDIEILAPDINALNLRIKGDVNLTVTGDVFEETFGDRHETISGNLYQRHFGDVHLVQDGNVVVERTGRYYEKSIGDKTITIDGNKKEFITKEDRQTVLGDKRSTVQDIRVEDTYGNKIETIAGQDSKNVIGSVMDVTLGEVTHIAKAIKRLADYDITDIALCGNINEQAHCDIIEVAQNGHIYQQALCNIFQIALEGSHFNEALKNIINIVKQGGMYNEASSGICNITTGSMCNIASGVVYNQATHGIIGITSGDILLQSQSTSGIIYEKAPALYRQGNFIIQDGIGEGTIQHVKQNWDNSRIYEVALSGRCNCVVQLDYPCSGCCWDEYSGFISGNWTPDITKFYYGTAEYFSTFIDLSTSNLADDSVCSY